MEFPSHLATVLGLGAGSNESLRLGEAGRRHKSGRVWRFAGVIVNGGFGEPHVQDRYKTLTTATEEFTLALKLASTTEFESLRSDSSVLEENRSESSRRTMPASWPMKPTST